MRIIAGSQRGRRLRTPPPAAPGEARAIRPTADRAREALFSIIGSRVRQARVLDLFAGSGALGLEALSRGAAEAVFVDASRPALALIAANIALCGFGGRSRVYARDLRQGLSFLSPPNHFELVFIDPPYGQGLAEPLLAGLAGGGFLAAEGLVVVEEEAGGQLPGELGGLVLVDQRRYGAAGFWLYRYGGRR